MHVCLVMEILLKPDTMLTEISSCVCASLVTGNIQMYHKQL